MLADGIQTKNKSSEIYIKDLAELLNENWL